MWQNILKWHSRNLRQKKFGPLSVQTALGMHVAAIGQSEYGFKSVR